MERGEPIPSSWALLAPCMHEDVGIQDRFLCMSKSNMPIGPTQPTSLPSVTGCWALDDCI